MIDQIAELNRVLVIVNSLTDEGKAVNRNIVLQECQRIAIEGRMPDHDVSVEFALQLGFLLPAGKWKIRLSSEGNNFLNFNPEELFDLTTKQKNFLLRRYFFDGEFQKSAKSFFKCFELSEKNVTFSWSPTDGRPLGDNEWLLDCMTQLGVIYRLQNLLLVKKEYASTISEFIAEPKGWTEDQLFEYLKEKKKLGDLAERLIFKWEVGRLKKAKHEVESHCVKLISKLDVGAGYDIKSFNGKSKGMKFDRFIEVKGSKGKGLRFIWSENEIKTAENLKENYWIYYLGGVDVDKKVAKYEPILYQNPLVSLKKDARLTMKGNGYVVEGKVSSPETTITILE